MPMLAGFLLWTICAPAATAGIREKMLLMTIQLPPEFDIALYADNVPGARSMALSPSGVLFVGTRQAGKVYAVLDKDNDGKVDQVLTIAEGLNAPNGVALWEGDLYVAEIGRILRFRGIESHLEKPAPPEVVTDQYPGDPRHGAKFIRFGPDGRLYVPVGAPCNVCLSDNPVFATITRINRDGGGLEIFAHGVRNTVGFDWHPATGVLWFTDNGRDWLGDNQPPDELNRADLKGLHFGFPYCHGGTIADPEFGGSRACTQFAPPVAALGPHAAALGMRFYTGRMFPEPYQGQIFIAEHGSWNREEKIGYRVMLVTLNGDQVASYTPFAQGWLRGNSAWGRPVDVQTLADGSLLVSDDHSGVIYRITYQAP
ncbi:MAG: sorbosone dehydrogenase family protein [Desulfobacteraceae bacterium]|nr:MAG: sorbosone dehydrogenase family protein [Desulfobacteraceae bacterium]